MTAKQRDNRRAYNKQLARLRRQEARMRARGYVFESDTGAYRGFVPQERPDRITAASVRKLERITSEEYYKRARYIDPSTGEVISGLEGKKREASAAAYKAAETRKAKKLAKPTEPEPEYEIKPAPSAPITAKTEVPLIEEFIALIKSESQLKEYGGWILDEYKGGSKGPYHKRVKEFITKAEIMLKGLSEDGLIQLKNELQHYFDSIQPYESSAVKVNTMDSFKSASESFSEFMSAFESAIVTAHMLSKED